MIKTVGKIDFWRRIFSAHLGSSFKNRFYRQFCTPK